MAVRRPTRALDIRELWILSSFCILCMLCILSILSTPNICEAEEAPVHSHEVSLGLTAVYDAGYDRGFHYGFGYDFSWSALRASALIALGDTNPGSEQHWAVSLGVVPWQSLRVDVGLHHRTFNTVNFGENLIRILCTINWRGFEFATGYVLKFPIVDQDAIHNPFVFDRTLFEHFLTYRIGYTYTFRNGLGVGFLTGSHSRFEQHNLDYPQFALVLTYAHSRIGSFRLDGGVGIAGFFNQGATIDRGFLRLEYSRVFRSTRSGANAQRDDESDENVSSEQEGNDGED